VKWLRIGFIVLAVLSAVLIGLSWAEQISEEVWYGDLRDYYPFGLYIGAKQLSVQPDHWIPLANDTYVQEAINKAALGLEEVWTWVQQDNYTSEFVNAGFPEYVLWLPNDSYYFIHKRYIDGIPEKYNSLPPPTTTASLLSIPWILFAGMVIVREKKRPRIETSKQT
jgi:hypothetical protein